MVPKGCVFVSRLIRDFLYHLFSSFSIDRGLWGVFGVEGMYLGRRKIIFKGYLRLSLFPSFSVYLLSTRRSSFPSNLRLCLYYPSFSPFILYLKRMKTIYRLSLFPSFPSLLFFSTRRSSLPFLSSPLSILFFPQFIVLSFWI